MESLQELETRSIWRLLMLSLSLKKLEVRKSGWLFMSSIKLIINVAMPHQEPKQRQWRPRLLPFVGSRRVGQPSPTLRARDISETGNDVWYMFWLTSTGKPWETIVDLLDLRSRSLKVTCHLHHHHRYHVSNITSIISIIRITGKPSSHQPHRFLRYDLQMSCSSFKSMTNWKRAWPKKIGYGITWLCSRSHNTEVAIRWGWL